MINWLRADDDLSHELIGGAFQVIRFRRPRSSSLAGPSVIAVDHSVQVTQLRKLPET